MSDLEINSPVAVKSEPAPAPVKPKRVAAKMTDKQKSDLNKHMEQLKKSGASLTEQRSHRMRMMGQLRKDPKMTVKKAHTAISKK